MQYIKSCYLRNFGQNLHLLSEFEHVISYGILAYYMAHITTKVKSNMELVGPPSPDFTGPVPLRRRSTAELRRSLSSLRRASSIASGESLRRVSDLSDPAISDVVFEANPNTKLSQNAAVDYEVGGKTKFSEG